MRSLVPFDGGVARLTSYIGGYTIPVSTAQSGKVITACDVRYGASHVTSEILWTPDMPEQAINSAKRAANAWRDLGFEKRLEIIKNAVARIESHKNELAALLTLEMGKRNVEALEEAGSMSGRLADRETVLREIFEGTRSGTTRKGGNQFTSACEPLGVAGIVGPFNYEYRSLFDPMFTALLAGNTVVIRPSTVAPRAIAMALGWIEDLFPQGVINCLFGPHSFGDALANSHDVDAFFITGGVETGLALAAKATSHGAKPSGELGGQGVLIVANDVSDEEAVEFILNSFAKRNVNQNCNGLRTVLFEGGDERAARVMVGVQQRLDKMVIGDPFLASGVDFGPMAKDPTSNFKKNLEWMYAQGAHEVYRQPVPGDLPEQGYWQGAVLYSFGEDSHAAIFNRNHTVEIFGHAVGFTTFRTAEAAVEAANNLSSRLTGVILCRDQSRGKTLARGMRWGNVHRNVPGPGAAAELPWGGHGTSIVGEWGGYDLPHAFVVIRNDIEREL